MKSNTAEIKEDGYSNPGIEGYTSYSYKVIPSYLNKNNVAQFRIHFIPEKKSEELDKASNKNLKELIYQLQKNYTTNSLTFFDEFNHPIKEPLSYKEIENLWKNDPIVFKKIMSSPVS